MKRILDKRKKKGRKENTLYRWLVGESDEEEECVEQILQDLWADMGDIISIQTTGAASIMSTMLRGGKG